MAKLGVVASTDPFWFPGGAEASAIMTYALCKERAGAMHPMKFFFDAGVVASSASDYPVTNPAYPLIGMQKGVIRQLPGRPDTLHNAKERVTIEQMIEAATINEAYQLLCDDITACDQEHIQDAPVLASMVGGEWVYTRA